MSIQCSLSHQGVTLIGRSTVIFAVLLIVLYSSDFWFSYNAADLGVWAVLVSIVITHFALLALESKTACRLFSPILKGKPFIVYRNWLSPDEEAITFGSYRVLWQAIDDVSLSPFGSLIFRSYAICGPPNQQIKNYSNNANIILKLPFAAIDPKTQKEFITLLKEKRPTVKLGRSLETLLDKPNLNSIQYIHFFTLLTFLAIFIDVGYSTFGYVELLKRYYLSDKAALEGSLEKAQAYYKFAEHLRAHPLPISFVSAKLSQGSSTEPAIAESRSRALWDMGEKTEALKAQKEAVHAAPKSFKINLRLIRLYAALGKPKEEQETIEKLIENHKQALIPRLYLASFLARTNGKDKAINTLASYIDFLCKGDNEHASYFSPPPIWPPVAEEVVHEIFGREDLQFLAPNKNDGHK